MPSTMSPTASAAEYGPVLDRGYDGCRRRGRRLAGRETGVERAVHLLFEARLLVEARHQHAGVVAVDRRRADILDLHLAGALPDQAERGGGLVAEVDDAAVDVGAAVVEADHHRLAVAEIGDPHVGRERQRRMRAGNGVGGEDLAVGGAAAVEIGAVPGGDAGRDVVGLVGRDVGLAADGIGLAHHVAPAAARRMRVVGDARRNGNAVLGRREGAALDGRRRCRHRRTPQGSAQRAQPEPVSAGPLTSRVCACGTRRLPQPVAPVYPIGGGRDADRLGSWLSRR